MSMKKKKNRKKRSNFIVPFCITLVLALATGLFCIFSYMWYRSGTDYGSGNQPLAKEVISVIPAGSVETGGGTETVPVSEGKYADILRNPEYMKENNIYAKEAAKEECVTIAFAGDILFDPNYAMMATLLRNGGDISNGIAPDLIAEMKAADIMMLNNEFAYSDRGAPLAEKQFTFRAKPSYVSYLHDLGVDIVSLANNHTYDYGEEALLDTLQTLSDAGIP